MSSPVQELQLSRGGVRQSQERSSWRPGKEPVPVLRPQCSGQGMGETGISTPSFSPSRALRFILRH